MNAPAQKPKYSTPYFQCVKYTKNHSLQGQVAGRPYLYNAKTHDVYRWAGKWVLMTAEELAAKPYLVNTLSVEYSKIDSSDDYANKRSRRRGHSVAATRACNTRRI